MGDGADKFDFFLRLGVRRPAMNRNRAITTNNMDVGAQIQPFGPLPPPDHAYGIRRVKGPSENVAAVISQWKSFDQDDQLRKYAKGEGKRDFKRVNMAALDAGMSSAKDWNRFCKTIRRGDFRHFLPEHTQRSFLERRKVRVPEKIEREGSRSDQIARLLSNDYGREWFLNQSATRQHDRNVAQIDMRMLGAKFDSAMEIHHAYRKTAIEKRNSEQQRRLLHPLVALAEIHPPKYVRNAQPHLSTRREGDRGWRPQKPVVSI